MYGDNIALLNIVPYMQKNNIKPYFAVLYKGGFSQYLEEHGYTFYILNYSETNYFLPHNNYSFFWLKKAVASLLCFFNRRNKINELASWAKKNNINLVHTNCSNTNLGFAVAQRLKVPHVWHIREYINEFLGARYFPNNASFRNKLKSDINYPIYITNQMAKYWCDIPGTVIYDGVVKLDNIPLIQPEKRQQILFVGRLVEEKGIKMVIKAFADIHTSFPNLVLLILGAGSPLFEQEIKDLIIENGISKYVKLLGYVNEVQQIMRESKAIIVASKYESFGFVTAEAMYNGCPVIGYDVGGTKEQFDNLLNEQGMDLGFRFHDYKTLVAQLKYVLVKSISLKDLKLAQETVLKLYSIEQSAHKVMKLYNSILHYDKSNSKINL